MVSFQNLPTIVASACIIQGGPKK